MKESNQHSVAILGSGESGMGALRLAVQKEYKVFLSDNNMLAKDVAKELGDLGVEYEQNGHTLDKITTCAEVVKSPGIPDDVSIIKSIREAGVPIISEIEFASRFTEAKIIGITGSNGKTTTTLLTHHLLKTAGLDVVAGGNLGESLATILLDRDPDVLVLELSSFQLDGIENFKPDVAVILNITPDHLNRYNNSMDNYADSKFRLAKNMTRNEVIILNKDNQHIQKRAGKVDARILEFSTQQKTKTGAYLDHGHLIFDCEKVIDVFTEDELALIGRHNAYNQMAAILVAIEMELSFAQILKGLSTFQNASHRMEHVANVDGVRYINDSKATNVDAVFYALEAINEPVVWIAGGVNKGNDYEMLRNIVGKKVKALICLGTDNRHLIEEFGTTIAIVKEVDSAEKAIKQAYDLASSGDVVLLSPACASFDLFKSYEDRGDQFKNAVIALQKELTKGEVHQ